jgi:hypothetical protein
MEGERKVSPNYCAVKWGVIDSKTNKQKNGQLSWVLNTKNLYFDLEYVENQYFDLEDEEKKYFNPSDLLQSRIENTTKMKISNLIWSMT